MVGRLNELLGEKSRKVMKRNGKKRKLMNDEEVMNEVNISKL